MITTNMIKACRDNEELVALLEPKEFFEILHALGRTLELADDYEGEKTEIKVRYSFLSDSITYTATKGDEELVYLLIHTDADLLDELRLRLGGDNPQKKPEEIREMAKEMYSNGEYIRYLRGRADNTLELRTPINNCLILLRDSKVDGKGV